MGKSNAIPARKIKAAFTLIELLVVVLILAILMAVSIPLYLSAVSDSQKKTCRANMQTIATAVSAARVRDRVLNFSTYFGTVDTTKETDLSSVPTCPSAGAYTLAAGASGGNFKVLCSFGTGATAHGAFEPGVNFN